MSDKVNEILPFNLLNFTSSASETIPSVSVDYSHFDNGIIIGWQVTALTGASSATIEVFESEIDGAPSSFTAVSTSRLILPQFFDDLNPADILSLSAVTGPKKAVSVFGVKEIKAFMLVKVTTVVPGGQSISVLANVFPFGELSPSSIKLVTSTDILSPNSV